MGRPRLLTVLINALVAGIAGIAIPHLPPFPAGLCIVAAIAFGVTALFAAVDWWRYTGTSERIRLLQAEAYTESVRKLEILERLNDEQLFALMHAYDVSEMIGDVAPETVSVMGENVDRMYLIQFMKESRFLPEIRQYSEGSKRRRWAEALTSQAITWGLADASRGNYPAQWRDDASWREARRRWGLDNGN